MSRADDVLEIFYEVVSVMDRASWMFGIEWQDLLALLRKFESDSLDDDETVKELESLRSRRV